MANRTSGRFYANKNWRPYEAGSYTTWNSVRKIINDKQEVMGFKYGNKQELAALMEAEKESLCPQ